MVRPGRRGTWNVGAMYLMSSTDARPDGAVVGVDELLGDRVVSHGEFELSEDSRVSEPRNTAPGFHAFPPSLQITILLPSHACRQSSHSGCVTETQASPAR